ncbi:MAG: GNAT family N-acetyltransferase [Fulvivirga sp.]|nr:GNAT family N-acetyltransferase [Fulvivirga sp.]
MITVRHAKFKELEIITDFQIKMARETEDLDLDQSVVEAGVEAVFEDAAKGIYYVAVNEKEEVLGCLMTTDEFSDWRNGTVIWIQSVYVKPEARKQGVFKALYQHIKDLVVDEEAYKGLRLYVEGHNITAQRAYINLGMTSDHYKMYEWMKEK